MWNELLFYYMPVLLGYFVLLVSLLPLLKYEHWCVRMWDFPISLNTLIAGTLTFYFIVFFKMSDYFLIGSAISSFIALLICLPKITPYLVVSFKKNNETVLGLKSSDSGTMILVSSNLQLKNTKYELFKKMIDENRPDFMFLTELDSVWAKELEFLKEDYPYNIVRPKSNTYGVAVYSKFEFVSEDVRYETDDDVPSLKVVVAVGGRNISVYCIHPRPPRPVDGDTKQRNEEISSLISNCRDDKNPLLAMGDFNDVPWSSTMKKLFKETSLIDLRRLWGLHSTVPSFFPSVGFPVDHILADQSFEALNYKVLKSVGSDHRPLLVTIKTKEAPA